MFITPKTGARNKALVVHPSTGDEEPADREPRTLTKFDESVSIHSNAPGEFIDPIHGGRDGRYNLEPFNRIFVQSVPAITGGDCRWSGLLTAVFEEPCARCPNLHQIQVLTPVEEL